MSLRSGPARGGAVSAATLQQFELWRINFRGSNFGNSSFAGSRQFSTFGSFGNTRFASNTSCLARYGTFGSFRGFVVSLAAGVGALTALEIRTAWLRLGRGFWPGYGYRWNAGFFGTSFSWAGEVGALASDGRIGVATGDRSWAYGWDPGGTTLLVCAVAVVQL